MRLAMIGLGRDGRQHDRAADARRTRGRRLRPQRRRGRSSTRRSGATRRHDLTRRRREARGAAHRLDHGARRAIRSTTRSPRSLPGLSQGDIIIDGGNSNFHDTMRRGAGAREVEGIEFIDSGTSGGIWGLENGYCLMVGGGDDAVQALRADLHGARAAGRLRARRARPGAGHYVKMVHNGIEYGMLQAYAEGYEILHASKDFRSSTCTQIAEVWHTAASCARGSTSSPRRAFENDAELERPQGLRRRLGRGPLDGAGSDRPRRAGAGDHAVAAHALPLAADRLVRREGDRRAAQRIRRPRGEEVMTTRAPSSPRDRARRRSARQRATRADPCTMVIFGALGDLSQRKLMPAIYQLAEQKLFPTNFAVLGVGARSETTDDGVPRRRCARRSASSDEMQRRRRRRCGSGCATGLFYVVRRSHEARTPTSTIEQAPRPRSKRSVAASRAQPAVLSRRAAERLRADAASIFGERARAADAHDRRAAVGARRRSRSRSAATSRRARALNRSRARRSSPSTRSIASITTSARRRSRTSSCCASRTRSSSRSGTGSTISHVQITAAETVGVEERGKYYEEAGVVRDMFQNHLLQLLTLTAMEPPSALTADAVRDEKVKVLRSIRWLTPRRCRATSVRAQYAAGDDRRQAVPGYRDEPDVAPDVDHADVRRGAPLRRQLALERRAVLPALRQAAGEARVGDRRAVPRAAASDVRAEGGRGDAPEHAGDARAAERRRLAATSR